MQNPKCSHGKILANFTITGATLSYHLKRMQSEGILRAERKGRETEYELVDSDKIANLLIAYKRSFMDALVDSFVSAWIAKK